MDLSVLERMLVASTSGSGSILFPISHPTGFVPYFVRATWSRVAGTSGTETASMQLSIRSRSHPEHALVLNTVTGVGNGVPLNVRYTESERLSYFVPETDEFVLSWSTPDGANLHWLARVGYIPISS